MVKVLDTLRPSQINAYIYRFYRLRKLVINFHASYSMRYMCSNIITEIVIDGNKYKAETYFLFDGDIICLCTFKMYYTSKTSRNNNKDKLMFSIHM